MQKWQCPIHNVKIETFICSKMWKIPSFFWLKKCLILKISLLWYRCTSDISIFAWRVRFCIREIYPVPCLSVVNVISYVPRQGRISSGSGLTFSGILSFLKQSGAISRLWSSLQDFSSNQNRHYSKLSTVRTRKTLK